MDVANGHRWRKFKSVLPFPSRQSCCPCATNKKFLVKQKTRNNARLFRFTRCINNFMQRAHAQVSNPKNILITICLTMNSFILIYEHCDVISSCLRIHWFFQYSCRSNGIVPLSRTTLSFLSFCVSWWCSTAYGTVPLSCNPKIYAFASMHFFVRN